MELLLHAGVDSSERISVELLDLASLDVALLPPFLLHVTGSVHPDWGKAVDSYQVRRGDD